MFRERGLGASHEAIAERAEVSVGTVYRRFPDREQLIDELFESELQAVVDAAKEATAIDDPWEGLAHFLTTALELAAANNGLRQLLTGSRHGAAKVELLRERLAPLAGGLLLRAREAGVVRADAEPQDVPLTILMVATLADAGRGAAPEAWRRYLAILLDGLRADSSHREGLPATVSAAQMDRIIEASHER